MANVKVFCVKLSGQTGKRTGQKLYDPDLSIQGHKKRNCFPNYYCANPQTF